MSSLRIIVVSAALVLSATCATAGSTVTLQDRQQAACFDDVQMLCSDFIPDIDKTTACMEKNRSKVRAACARFYVKDKPAG